MNKEENLELKEEVIEETKALQSLLTLKLMIKYQ